MQASVHFRCSSCGARIKAPPELIGHTRPCPGCGELFIVPEAGGNQPADDVVGGALCSCSMHPAFVCANSLWNCQDSDMAAARARAIMERRQAAYGFAS